MKRFREFRKDQATRDKYADVTINVKDFIFPYFVVEGEGVKDEISTMPGIYRFSIDTLVEDVKACYALGIDKVLLFGVIEDELKDAEALVAKASKVIDKDGFFSINGPDVNTWNFFFKDAMKEAGIEVPFIDDVIAGQEKERDRLLQAGTGWKGSQ